MFPITSASGRETYPGRLQSQITNVAGVAVLRLTGEIDLSETERLESAFAGALPSADGVLGLDLAGVSFVDAAGLGAILRWIRRADVAGVHVDVRSVSNRVRRVFDLTGNGSVLAPFTSLADVPIAASVETEGPGGAPDG